MLLAIEIIGIIVMCTFLVLFVWSFIILNKMFSQIKYKNYLMEKLAENVRLLSSASKNKDA